MWEWLRSVQPWLAGPRWLRRLADPLLRIRARRRAAELDGRSVARWQRRTLAGLVHQARATRFGRDHDFGRIRTPADFRRLVPLQTPATLWQNYWQPALPALEGATWPGPVYRLGAGPAGEDLLPVLPLSAGLVTGHRAALRTALALAAHDRPDAFRSPWLFLGHSLGYLGGRLQPPPGSDPVRPGGGGFWRRARGLLRGPYLLPPAGPVNGEEVAPLAEHAARQDITCLAGPANRLVGFLDQVRKQAGRDSAAEVWPGLAAVLYSAGSLDAPRERLRQAVGGDGVRLLETYTPPEGPAATEDPRFGLLRLLPDVGSYFEFVPAEDLGKPQPARHGAEEVVPGVRYDLALTSPAGLWACLTGARVCFERRDPPLFRLLEAQPLPEKPPALAAAHPFPAQPPHPRNGHAQAGGAYLGHVAM